MRLTALLLTISVGASAAPHRDARRAGVVGMPTQQRLDGSPGSSRVDARRGEVWRWHVGAGLRHHVGLLSDQRDEQNRSIIERRVEGDFGWALTLPYALRLGGSVPYLIDQVGVYPGYQSGPLPSSLDRSERLGSSEPAGRRCAVARSDGREPRLTCGRLGGVHGRGAWPARGIWW